MVANVERSRITSYDTQTLSVADAPQILSLSVISHKTESIAHLSHTSRLLIVFNVFLNRVEDMLRR